MLPTAEGLFSVRLVLGSLRIAAVTHDDLLLLAAVTFLVSNSELT